MTAERKDVVIIGNGPSAMTLSYILAGNWPYYDDLRHPHPNLDLHQRLVTGLRLVGSRDTTGLSLVEGDLEYLCSGDLEGRSINPVSVLFDSLQHPEADVGSNHPSCLRWDKSAVIVDHVVLGSGDVGGSWSKLSEADEILSVSFANWMSLPGLPIDRSASASKRISLADVSRYFMDYVKKNDLQKYFRPKSVVTGVKLCCFKGVTDGDTNLPACDHSHPTWTVTGWQEGKGHFEYVTPKVVLATGNSDVPNRLRVKGEDLPFVLDSFTDLDRVIRDLRTSTLRDPVVIVGSGLTAADAILACQTYRLPVIHVFRRHPEDPALIFNQLPENLYPEYHAVHARMKGRRVSVIDRLMGTDRLTSPTFDYKSFPMHSVTEIRKNKEVVLTNLACADNSTSRTTVKASYVLTLIGRRPDLTFIGSKKLRDLLPVFADEPVNPRSNPIRINPFTHSCLSIPGLYAMGPLVGDNFVRFVQGAAIAVCHDIVKGLKSDLEERPPKSKSCLRRVLSGRREKRPSSSGH